MKNLQNDCKGLWEDEILNQTGVKLPCQTDGIVLMSRIVNRQKSTKPRRKDENERL